MNRVYCVPKNAKFIVEASVVLHNYLISKKPISQREADEAREIWYQKLEKLKPRNYQPPSATATEMRDYLREYFISEYPIESQYQAI